MFDRQVFSASVIPDQGYAVKKRHLAAIGVNGFGLLQTHQSGRSN
jgi:hypothetical protein